MKVISNKEMSLKTISLNPMSVEPTEVKLWSSLILMGTEAAQLIVCDNTNQLNNLVCVMNLSPDPYGDTACTKILDGDERPEVDEESGLQAELAQSVGIKLCKKTGLK